MTEPQIKSSMALPSKAAGFTSLDIALANLLQTKQPSDDPRHVWLAALASHQWGRGHACLDLAALQNQANTLLGWSDEQVAALPADLHLAVATLPWAQGDASPLVISRDASNCTRLYLRRAWTAEQSIRQQIIQRLAMPVQAPADLQQRLDALFPKTSNEPDMQRHSCEVAAQNRITLITGGPGTGKTTTVVKLLSLLVGASTQELQIHLAAPTGKAAARLSESIRHALTRMPEEVRNRIPTHTQTLHRLLQKTHTKTLAADVVIVDEASMIDLEMMARLLQAVPTHARLILLGDKDQLASVEAGAVMSQLCTGTLLQNQTVTLTQSHRFNANSGIGKWAQAVNAQHKLDNTAELKALWHEAPDWIATLADDSHDVTRLQLPLASDPKLAAGLKQGWKNWLALLAEVSASNSISTPASCNDAQALALLNAFSEFCVLCALRDGPLGVTQLNAHVEQALGFASNTWYIGRPVMVTRNDYALGLMNGDIGLCLPDEKGVLRVAFPQADATNNDNASDKAGENSVRWVMPSRLESVETVFAMTVHKSQGSEFSHVLLVLPAQESPVLTRELVYTGLTRARQRLTLWAPQPGVLFNACKRQVIRSGGLKGEVTGKE
jgi:exodeoxyribonuclease V alpha subunit